MCVRIFPLEFHNTKLIEAVIETIQERFGITVKLQTESFGLKAGLDPIRNQVNSNWILEQLQNRFPDIRSKVLGLTDRDLFSPVLTYVFGEASLGGVAAVVSTNRFHNEYYGLPVDTKALESRLIAEVIHELGHTFGLIHCQHPKCVMHPCSYVEEIDQKSSNFCNSCLQQLSSIKK